MIKHTVKVDVYKIVQECVNRGIRHGWRHAHKHTDKPSFEYTLDCLETNVMNELCDYIDFGEEVAEDKS
jgi:hypothetical protein